MKKSNIKLKVNELTGDYEIIHKGFSWISDGRAPYIIIRKKMGGKYISTYRTLYSAPKRKIEYSDNKIVTRLSGLCPVQLPILENRWIWLNLGRTGNQVATHKTNNDFL